VALLSALLAAAFFFIGQAVGLSFWESLLFGIGILVANVPEGLLPTVTLSLAMATQRMARRRALVRHLLRQDRHPHGKPHDGAARLFRPALRRRRRPRPARRAGACR
jgi:hypothetical protein